MTIKEFDPKVKIDEKVTFYVGQDKYLGTVTNIFAQAGHCSEVRVSILSGNITFLRGIHEVEKHTEDQEWISKETRELINSFGEPERSFLNNTRNEPDFPFVFENGLVYINNNLMSNEDKTLNIDLISGFISVYGTLEPAVEYEETEFRTENGCEYSIFEDDEIEENYHIEVDPDWVWNKDDVWELIQKLLYTIGEVDENGDLIGEGPEKPLFIISTPNAISDQMVQSIKIDAENALKSANIDAITVVLSEGLKAHFSKANIPG